MDYDVELMRDLLLVLEERQVSPRATVIVEVDEVAMDLGRRTLVVEEGLNTLLTLGYIDGPGPDDPGLWFFRKLTRKGVQFIQATRSPADWARMKTYFAQQRSPSRA